MAMFTMLRIFYILDSVDRHLAHPLGLESINRLVQLATVERHQWVIIAQ